MNNLATRSECRGAARDNFPRVAPDKSVGICSNLAKTRRNMTVKLFPGFCEFYIYCNKRGLLPKHFYIGKEKRAKEDHLSLNVRRFVCCNLYAYILYFLPLYVLLNFLNLPDFGGRKPFFYTFLYILSKCILCMCSY